MADQSATEVKAKVTVKTPRDKKIVEIDEGVTVKELREEVARAFEVPLETVCLIYAGNTMKDAETLRQHGIKDGITVHLVIRSQAGSSTTRPSTPSTGSRPVMPERDLMGRLKLEGGSFAEMQRQFMSNPNTMSQVTDEPMVQQMMNNPEIIRQMIMTNPNMRELMDRDPEVTDLLTNPDLVRQTMDMVQNPAMLQKLTRTQDQAMSNLESLAGDFNDHDIQEPMMIVATEGLGNNPSAALLNNSGAGGSGSGSTSSTGRTQGEENREPLPNPWSRPSPSGSSAETQGTTTTTAGMMNSSGMQSMVQQLISNPQLVQNTLQSPLTTSVMQEMANNSATAKQLQDLPMELREHILVEAVVMEVEAMKLAKSVWKEKADLVMSRLKTVCSEWNSILTTNFFRNEVHRMIDSTVVKTIRLEILHQSPIQSGVFQVVALKDEIFMLYTQSGEDYVINVYNRTNVVDVKDVIPLPGIQVDPKGLAACNVSDCLYAIDVKWVTASEEWQCLSVWRIRKVEEHQYCVSPWISDLSLPLCSISISGNGNVIIHSELDVISIYNADASLQHEIVLSLELDIYSFRGGDRIFQKSNGNLVVASHNMQYKTDLTEIDLTGRMIRQYHSSVGGGFTSVKFADIYGRILISDSNDRMELLDSEFNLLNFSGPQLVEGKFDITHETQYSRERNEMVGVAQHGGLTIFRFTEE